MTAKELQSKSSSVEEALEIGGVGHEGINEDGTAKRTGTLVTASAHIITAVIGSGVLSLVWAIAQMGWVAGPIALVAFSLITWFCSVLLADCYRTPDPVKGKRNRTYTDAVRACNLGGWKFKLCGISQHVNIVGGGISYTISTAISMVAVKRSICSHRNGHHAACHASTNTYTIIYGAIQIVLSQIPNFHKLWWLSIVAAIMSFAYSFIVLGLSIAKIAGADGGDVRTTLTGVTVGVDVSGSEKLWRIFQALGNIAFAYSFSIVLIEIEDTLKPNPPENQVMKKASFIGVSTTTIFYMLCGVLGYAAFGNDAPGNFLADFGSYNPFWLVDVANVGVAIHLVGAYQVFCQPTYQFVENWVRRSWPDNAFLTAEHTVGIPLLGVYSLNFFRLAWRTAYVVATTVVAMIFPFFNNFVGLIGALGFWPLTVYLPVEMYIAQAKIRRFSGVWAWLQLLSMACLVVSVAAVCGSVQGLIHALTD